MKRALILIFIITMAAAFGCSKAGLQEQVVMEKGKDHVLLIHETDKQGKVVPKGYGHPANFTAEQVDQMLDMLTYSEYSFFKWRGSKPVFYESERGKLAESISKALAAADQDSWIKFAVTAKKRDLLLPTRRITNGYIFVQDGRLNLVFSNLNFEISEEETPYSGDPIQRYTLGTLKINEGENLSYPAINEDIQSRKRPHTNWIIIHNDKLFGKVTTEVVGPSEDTKKKEPAGIAVKDDAGKKNEVVEDDKKPAPPEKSIEERLAELKLLLEKGLISQEDYEKKKQAILDDL